MAGQTSPSLKMEAVGYEPCNVDEKENQAKEKEEEADDDWLT